ncbi:MAG TPA: hypothetical protein VFR09_09090 [Alphaproteobacteria bacterium]|nr:hypothetical protein [Alphaproteobacteria bacterium]
MMRIGLGVIIAIVLIVFWWVHDHPQQAPATNGALEIHDVKAG